MDEELRQALDLVLTKLGLLAMYSGMPLHWGKATSGAKDKLVDQAADWEEDIWAGYEVVFIEGTGAGQIRLIKSNDVNSITPRSEWSEAPDGTTVYVIRTARAIVANRNSWTPGQKNVTSAGTAEQLPNVEVPDGFEFVVKAKVDNTSYIYYGNSKANAEDSSKRATLSPDESMAFRITNANLIWIDAAISGEGIEYIVEQ